MVVKEFINTSRKNKLFKKKDRIILGVSGGPDSVCMLYIFCILREEFKLNLVCAHFNHALRKEADADEEFVKKLCLSLKVRFVSATKDVGRFFKGDSMEQTARRLRFDFFLNCSRKFKIKKIALAHTKDDVVETVLMRIIRGSALRGLRAIMPLNTYKGIRIIRPLISVTKDDIIKWLNKNGYSYRLDKTNFEDKFLRNKVRNRLIGLLREFNPGIENALYNLSKISAYDYDFIHSYARSEFISIKRASAGNLKLEIRTLNKLHPAVVFEIIRIAIEEIKGDLRKIELKHLEEIMDLISSRPSGSIVDLPGVEVRREQNYIIIKSLIL